MWSIRVFFFFIFSGVDKDNVDFAWQLKWTMDEQNLYGSIGAAELLVGTPVDQVAPKQPCIVVICKSSL